MMRHKDMIQGKNMHETKELNVSFPDLETKVHEGEATRPRSPKQEDVEPRLVLPLPNLKKAMWLLRVLCLPVFLPANCELLHKLAALTSVVPGPGPAHSGHSLNIC